MWWDKRELPGESSTLFWKKRNPKNNHQSLINMWKSLKKWKRKSRKNSPIFVMKSSINLRRFWFPTVMITPPRFSITKWKLTITDTLLKSLMISKEKKSPKELKKIIQKLKKLLRNKCFPLIPSDWDWLWTTLYSITKSRTIPNKLVKSLRLPSMTPLLTLKIFKMPTTEMQLQLCNWWRTIWLFGPPNWMMKKREMKMKRTD